MFDTILLPLDPKEPDEVAAAFGIRTAERFDSDLLILSVIDRPQQRDQIRADFEESVRGNLDMVLADASDRGVHVEIDIREGEAHEEIIQVAETGADLIVMGTAAREGLDRIVLGSVAESVVQGSPVPVMMVPPVVRRPTDV